MAKVHKYIFRENCVKSTSIGQKNKNYKKSIEIVEFEDDNL